MKNFLVIDETQTALVQFLKVATRFKRELLTDVEMKTVPLIELSSLTEAIHVKMRDLHILINA